MRIDHSCSDEGCSQAVKIAAEKNEWIVMDDEKTGCQKEWQ